MMMNMMIMIIMMTFMIMVMMKFMRLLKIKIIMMSNTTMTMMMMMTLLTKKSNLWMSDDGLANCVPVTKHHVHHSCRSNNYIFVRCDVLYAE